MNEMKMAGLGSVEPPAARTEEAAGNLQPDDASVVFLEPGLWKRLNEAVERADIADAWLVLQCRMIVGAVQGVLLLRDEQGSFAVAASWPAGLAIPAALMQSADVATLEKRGIVSDPGEGAGAEGPSLAYPILADDEMIGAVAILLDPRHRAQMRPAMRQLQWGVAGIRERLRRQGRDTGGRQLTRLKSTLDCVAGALEQNGFMAAAMAVVTELAVLTGAERVSVGFQRRGTVRIAAISHSAQFGRQMNLVRLLSDAMDEAVDQQALIVYPPASTEDPVATSAHARLAEVHHVGHVLTIPLLVADRFVGALTFESPDDRPFDAETIELLDGIAAAIGPILDEKRLNDRWIGYKIVDSARRQLHRMFGPAYLGRKLLAVAALALVAYFSFATRNYRVTAEAEIEGLVRRAVVAPTDGFIKDASGRAGDTVRAGDLLASLDDRDLALQRLRWVTERQQHIYEKDKALAARQLATVNVVNSQIDQADAQIKLIDEQLGRSRLVAPFDGIIVSGDLSQSIGAPVPRGQVLYEIAPLNSYRVNIAVDERQIADIEVGQRGEMLASSLADEPFPFVIEKITPIAQARNGQNVFRVEAQLTAMSPRLRPGMDGVAKIDVDRRLLISIWARPFIDWVRVRAWAWFP